MPTPQNIGNDLELANLDYQRKQAIANALRQQSMQSPQGQMIGRRYVAPSFTQNLAQLMEGYQAGNLEDKNIGELKQARQAYDTRNQNEMQNFMQAMRPTPATTIQPLTPNDDEGNVNAPIQMPAQAPDNAKALAMALSSKAPALQSMGAKLFERQFKEPKWEKVELPTGKGATKVGWVDVNSPDPEKTFRLGGEQGAKGIVNNGVIENPYDIGKTTPKQAPASNPATDLLIPDGLGGFKLNDKLVEAKKLIAKSGASNIHNTVSAAAPENEYNKKVGGGLAEASLSAVEAAKAAPEVVKNAQSIRSAIKGGAITGTGAEVRQTIQKALETAGLVGEGKAATTQELMSGLGKITLSGIKSSGLGGGNGFTNQDREFLQGAISGTIDSTPANLLRVADISERVARANHAKGSAITNRWAKEPSLKNITQDVVIDQLPPPANPLSPTKANAAKLPTGAKFLGFEQ